MKERPILFSGPMVAAILADRKTQTRRIVKNLRGEWFGKGALETHVSHAGFLCPHGQPGDRLWVKETFSAHGAFGIDGRISYRADIPDGKQPNGLHWKPSIFMPRLASRISLEITGVRVERLQDISEADAKAEGVAIDKGNAYHVAGHEGQWAHATSRGCMETLWDSLNAKRGFGWDVNPWVWVITFKRIK